MDNSSLALDATHRYDTVLLSEDWILISQNAIHDMCFVDVVISRNTRITKSYELLGHPAMCLSNTCKD